MILRILNISDFLVGLVWILIKFTFLEPAWKTIFKNYIYIDFVALVWLAEVFLVWPSKVKVLKKYGLFSSIYRSQTIYGVNTKFRYSSSDDLLLSNGTDPHLIRFIKIIYAFSWF